MTASAPGRARRAAAWLAPSLAAACAGAVVGGLAEAVLRGAPGVVAAAGFAAVLAIPVASAAGIAVRALWLAWRPRRLAQRLVDERGGAPRLLAWILYLALAAFFLSWATFNGVRLLARLTSFTPVVVSVVMPPVVLIAAAAAAAVARPLVDLLAAAARAIDRRAHARLGRSVMTPPLVLTYTLIIMVAFPVIGWLVSVRPRIGHLDLGLAIHPVVTAPVCAAVHLVWGWLGPRARAAGAAIAFAAAAALVGTALWVRHADPGQLLSLWREPTLAGFAIDLLYDVDRVRDSMPATAFRPAARAGAAHPDIILVTIDTVRADRTPLGGGPAKMPTLAALGQRGTVFELAFAPGNVTRRSIPSIGLGLSPTRVRGRVIGWALHLDPRHVMLAERLRAGGYQTAGFFCCDSFWGKKGRLGLNRGIDTLFIEHQGGDLARAARTWLEERDKKAPDRPLFVWAHFIEPHNWVAAARVPGGDGDRRRQYDDSLAAVDRFLADVVAPFAGRPAERQPIIIVTADHGEGLGDHGAPYHSQGLYNSQLRVPLVIAGPGARAQRIPEPVGLVDLAPTILDLAGFVPPAMPAMDGHSVADLVSGTRTPNADAGYAFSAQVVDRSVGEGMRAVVEGRWKLIETPRGRELYDMRTDPDERRDLANLERERFAHMRQLLDRRAAIDRVPAF